MKLIFVCALALVTIACAGGGVREVKVRHEYPEASYPDPFGGGSSPEGVFTDTPGDGKPGN